MIDPTVHLRVVGAALLILSPAHLWIGRHLSWRADASRMSAINRQIFHTHTFFLCLTLAMMGTLCLFYTQTLTTPTPLARVVLWGLMIFWGARLIFQWFVYEWSHWRGHRLYTFVHVVFTLMWAYFTLTFWLALRLQYAN